MKLQRKDLEQVHSALRKCCNLTGEKFTYMIEKNVNTLLRERKSIDKFREGISIKEPSKELIEFETFFRTIDQQLQSGEITEAIAKEKEVEIREKFPEEAKISDEFVKKYKEFLEQEIDIKFHTVKREDLPAGLTGDMRIGISEFIEE
jgi:hypothetical protein